MIAHWRNIVKSFSSFPVVNFEGFAKIFAVTVLLMQTDVELFQFLRVICVDLVFVRLCSILLITY